MENIFIGLIIAAVIFSPYVWLFLKKEDS